MDRRESSFKRLLDGIFYGIGTNSLAQFQNPSKLAAAAKHQARTVGLSKAYVTVQRVRQYLRAQPTVQAHRPTRKRFPRTAFVSPALNHIWLVDVGYLQHLSRNKPAQPGYFLLAMDLFSRRLEGELLFGITSQEVCAAFERIITRRNVLPARVGSDRGKEFIGKEFQRLLKRHKIEHYTSNDTATKMAPIERAMKTTKSLLHRMLSSDTQQRSYIELFPIVIYSYNNRHHSALPKSVPSPEAVNSTNAKLVYDHTITRRRRKMKEAGLAKFKLDLGDIVRLSKFVGPLYKGFKLWHWSAEVYTIVGREGSIPPRYRLSDYTNTPVEGSFYFEELQRIPPGQSDPKPYKASKVLARRKQMDTGRPQVLVVLEGPEADSKTAFWLDEALVEISRQQNRSGAKKATSAPNLEPPSQRTNKEAQKQPTVSPRKSGRQRRAPNRLDL